MATAKNSRLDHGDAVFTTTQTKTGKNTINHSRLTIQSPQERERLRLPPLLMQFQKNCCSAFLNFPGSP